MVAPRTPSAHGTVLAVAVVALAAAVYVPAYEAGFIWDDDQYVEQNPTLRDPAGLGDIWFRLGATPQYYPAVFTTFWIEYRIWGSWPAGYHAVNVLLHGIAAALVGIVLTRLGIRGAWLAAALFAVHPVHVESVAWITERKNVLSAVFYLTSFACLVRFSALDGRSPPRRPALAYASSLAMFVLALWSKTVTASMPAAYLLVVWWKCGRIERRHVRISAPFFALGAILAGITVWMERHHVGAQGETWDLSLAERFLVAGRAVWFYLGKLIWPLPLAFNYERWTLDSLSFVQWCAPVSALGLPLLMFWMRRRWGRAPLAATLFFGGTLLPALGFFDVFPFRYSFVADHFQYLASLGPITLVAACVMRWIEDPRWKPFGAALAALILIALGSLTWRQCHVYRNLEILWQDTLAKNPRSWLAHNNLGTLLMDRGAFVKAEGHFRAAVEAAPTYHESRNNLAVALARQGRTSEALEAARETVRVSPRYTGARNTLGLLLARVGRLQQAEAEFRECLRLDPDYAKAHAGLGTVLIRSGRLQEGLHHLEEAVRLAPDSAEARANLASALAAAGRSREAREQADEALRLAPENPAIRSLQESLGEAR